MINMAGTAYLSEAPGFTPGFLFVVCCVVLWCVVFSCFVCLRSVFCVVNVASVSGLSNLDCSSGFL